MNGTQKTPLTEHEIKVMRENMGEVEKYIHDVWFPDAAMFGFEDILAKEKQEAV